MSQRILVGGLSGGTIFRLGYDQPNDNGAFVPFVAVSQVYASPDWYQELTMRFAVVLVSANAGLVLRLTPILEGNALDGTGGQPDCRVTFVTPVPSAVGVRSVAKVKVGLFNRIRLQAGDDFGRTGLRGAWAQFRLETLASPILPSGETEQDVRFDGIVLDYTPRPSRVGTAS
jgi:hypothetical protein